jgi:hypothetical protein
MKVTVHLNEAHGSYIEGFVPSKAELVDAGTYALPASQYVPDRNIPGMTADEGAANQELYVRDILNFVYEQLNVGGDLIPAEDFTEAYRAAGGRSLSVGDLVTLDGTDVSLLGYQGTYAVEKVGFQKVLAAGLVVRRGLARHARNQEAVA